MQKINESVRKKDNITRKKEIFSLPIEEFEKGDWLKNLKINNKYTDIKYGNGYLTITTIVEKN